jgi:hypothetical protein
MGQNPIPTLNGTYSKHTMCWQPLVLKYQIKEEPRWICDCEAIISKKYSSLVITLDTESSQKELLVRATLLTQGEYSHLSLAKGNPKRTL